MYIMLFKVNENSICEIYSKKTEEIKHSEICIREVKQEEGKNVKNVNSHLNNLRFQFPRIFLLFQC